MPAILYSTPFHKLFRLYLCILLLSAVKTGYAQKSDTSDKMTVYPTAKEFIHVQTDSGQVNKFIDSAVFYQGTDTLYCDSLYQNITTNTIEAFSNVRIAQAGGTQAMSDYLKYISAKKLAYMHGNVSLTDGKNKLWCDDLTYNLATKYGVYNNSGTLQADSTTVTSNTGEYNVKTKDARFTGKVTVTDPQYYTTSDDMGYNTDTKMTRFFARSVVTGDSGKTTMTTTGGTYDSHAGLAYFYTHSTIWYDGQYIEGDTLYYNKPTGYGYGYGHVIAIDTGHQSTLYCGRTTYNKKKRTLQATEKPVLMQVKGADTLYMRADTFYSAPVVQLKNDTSKIKMAVRHQDTSVKFTVADDNKKAKKGKQKKNNKSVTAPMVLFEDSSVADTSAPLYFSGYHHVRIFSDSMQGVCDSICYTQSDSTIRMMYNPIAWSRNSQITGDTIVLLLDSNRIKNIFVPNNAFVVSLAGPEKAQLYDQVQGKILKGYFKHNTINNMLVYPNAESIYYSKDDSGAFIGVVQATSDRMHILFEDQKIRKIILEQDTHQTMTPLDKADLPSTRLSRFKWLLEKRPKNKEELFE